MSSVVTGRHQTLGFAILTLCLVAIYLYFNLFVPPLVPIYRDGDQGVWLTNSLRILYGDIIYKDFYQFLLPGTEMLYASVFSRGGHHVLLLDLVLLITGVLLAAITIGLSRSVIAGRLAFMPAVFLIVVPYTGYLDGTHRWYSEAACMAAVLAIMKGQNPSRVVVAGAMSGVATCFTLTQGIMSLLTVLVFNAWCQNRHSTSKMRMMRRALLVIAPYLVVTGIILAYCVYAAGLWSVVDNLLLFNLRYTGAMVPENAWYAYLLDIFPESVTAIHWHLVFILVPFIYIIVLDLYRRNRKILEEAQWKNVILLAIAGILQFVAIMPAASILRMNTVCIPAIILLFWLIGVLSWREKFIKLATVAILVGLAMMQLYRVQFWNIQRKAITAIEIPAGRSIVYNVSTRSILQWLAMTGNSNTSLLVTENVDLYFLLALKNPAKVPFLTNTGFTRPEQVADVKHVLEHQRIQFVLWSNWTDDKSKIGYSAAADPLEPLRIYLANHYHPVYDTGEAVLWQRNDDA